MKKKIAKIGKRAALAGYMLAGMLLQFPPMAVNARNKTGAAAVKSSLKSFYSIVAAFVSSVGAIILLWGVFEWGTSMQANDGSMQANAFKRIGGGLVMILAPQIIKGFI